MSSITGKTALVSGGGSGIGLAIAERLAADGAQVTICGRTEDKLVGAVEKITPSVGDGGSIRQIVADVTVEEQIAEAVGFAADPGGGLDILVANAGGSLHMGAIEEFDAEAVRGTIDLNLMGTMLSVKHAIPLMRGRADAGSVIAISSGAGGFPHRWLWAYGASKAGIDMFCTSAAEELGPDIRVNSVQPGIVDDELMSMITAGGPLLDDYIAGMPMERVGTVDDIAQAVRFLAGPESSWITGVNLPIDGGHHLRHGANYQLLFGE
jgi:NAD(P)-dependent dehydrogenase (short-subunit alcohol dehydrogenase family)